MMRGPKTLSKAEKERIREVRRYTPAPPKKPEQTGEQSQLMMLHKRKSPRACVDCQSKALITQGLDSTIGRVVRVEPELRKADQASPSIRVSRNLPKIAEGGFR